VRGVGRGDLDHRQARSPSGPVPAPPYSVGTSIPIRPFSPSGADVFEGELATAVEVLGGRRDLLARDAARDVLDHQLLFGEAEIHLAHSGGGSRSGIVAAHARKLDPHGPKGPDLSLYLD
jgi:hypothetical protein